MDIPIDKYLAYALKLKSEEEALRRTFETWLPEEIIDCHAHCNTREHVRTIAQKSINHMLSTFPFYSIEDSHDYQRLLHPTKRIRSLRFPKTFNGIEHRRANEYLLTRSPLHDRVAIFGLPEDIDYTIGMLLHPRCSALKMYHSYVEPNAELIYGFFPPAILEAAQDRDIPIVLHVPRVIVQTIDDTMRLLRDFPRLRVSLAHLGLSKFVIPGLRQAYEALAPFEQLSLDTALNPSAEVVHLALSCFGPERVMYGSDEPLHLIRSVAYRHPEKGERLATDYPYHWVDPREHAAYKHLAKDVVHAHWQSLGALKQAIEAFPEWSHAHMKQQIFHDNASTFFGF